MNAQAWEGVARRVRAQRAVGTGWGWGLKRGRVREGKRINRNKLLGIKQVRYKDGNIANIL